MPSSTSSSELAPRHALAAGLRLTAADRPGVAQPVPERDIPDRPWRPIFACALALTVLLCVAWELAMRTEELVTDDSGYSVSAWAEQRRRIDAEPSGHDMIAIVGDSRILYDTDLDRFQALTGLRPIQLALPGTNCLPFFEDISRDPKFRGLLIVGIAETSYFRTRIGLMRKALASAHWESPSARLSYRLLHFIRHFIVMLDEDYRLSNLLRRTDHGLRPGADSPYEFPWKIGLTGADRQTRLWPRLDHDDYLRDHARHAWDGFRGPPVSQAIIADTLRRTREAVARIRARGGDVIFVRPPSAPQLRVNEEQRLPKAKGWDTLLADSHVQGIHIDDMPQLQGLVLPEWSHLRASCATIFTDAYVRKLTEHLPGYRLLPNAPPSLASADCLAG